eukprot:COSAG01_NODE_16498_length_1232_cov_0.809356_1_plen_39_part_01
MMTHDLEGMGSVGGRITKNQKSFWRSRQGPLERYRAGEL